MKLLNILAAGVFAIAAFSVSSAEASVVEAGGVTVIDVTFPLDDAGITANTIGGAGVTEQGFVSFGVTGGQFDADALAGEILHDGGLSLVVRGAPTTQVRDFTISVNDDGTGSVLGDVRFQSLMLDDVELFTFNLADLSSVDALFDLENPTLPLFISATLAGFLEDAYGLDAAALVGELFGFAATSFTIAEVPLPASLPLFLAGLAGFGFASRMRRA